MSKKRMAPQSFDEMCKFDVNFSGVEGSDAHYAHHQTLMAKLTARAFVREMQCGYRTKRGMLVTQPSRVKSR